MFRTTSFGCWTPTKLPISIYVYIFLSFVIYRSLESYWGAIWAFAVLKGGCHFFTTSLLFYTNVFFFFFFFDLTLAYAMYHIVQRSGLEFFLLLLFLLLFFLNSFFYFIWLLSLSRIYLKRMQFLEIVCRGEMK